MSEQNKNQIGPGLVSFVGAGPGDPELLTVRGRKAIEDAGLVLYAGSLVPQAVVACAGASARLVDSVPLTLWQNHALVREAALAGQNVARVHTGDPSLYGALREQAELLDQEDIPWRVIPGVTAACAAAAAAGITFTVPKITQTLVISRMEGRIPMPDNERMHKLAAFKTSMAIYLAGRVAENLSYELSRALPRETPVLCAHRVSQPEEKLVWTDVENMAACIAEHNIESQTIVLVLPAEGKTGAPSRLYAEDFSHTFRNGK